METLELYGGKVRLSFEPGKHKYQVQIGEEVLKPPSVTTVTGLLDKSGPLTQWAANQTAQYVREHLLVENSTWELSQIERLLEEARFRFREVKMEAASIGSQAHAFLEDYQRTILTGQRSLSDFIEETAPLEERVKRSVEAGIKWLGKHNVKPLMIERSIYSIRFNYAGRLDKTAEVDGKYCIVDWKTGKEIYEEFILQIAAYAEAINEEDGRFPEGAWLVRLGKETGEFEAHWIGQEDLQKAFVGFWALLDVYNWRKSWREKLREERKNAKAQVGVKESG